ncbi:MAG: endo-1,4-beta-xylanase [Waterburya sp.]
MPTTLKDLAAKKGIVLGGYPQRNYLELSKDETFKNLFAKEYALAVGGFFGVTVNSKEGIYDFKETDVVFDFAKQNNLLFRGHPLIWNEFNPKWLIEKFKTRTTTSAEVEKIFTNHILTLAKRYAGKVHSWDVVNEAINVEDGRADFLKDTTKSTVRGTNGTFPSWLHYLGSSYIEKAFRLANQADPKAVLCYNDFGLLYSNPFGNSWEEKRRVAILKFLENLKSKGTPIHALGIQSHLEGHRMKDFDSKKFRAFLSDVASLGLKIIISELDVKDTYLPKDIKTRDQVVADNYYQYLSVALDEPAVTSVIFWGLCDRYTWINEVYPRPDGEKSRPLVFNENYKRKRAYNSVVKSLNEAKSRTNV